MKNNTNKKSKKVAEPQYTDNDLTIEDRYIEDGNNPGSEQMIAFLHFLQRL